MPDNVKFFPWDALGGENGDEEVPADMKGKYDVVHLGIFMLVIKGGAAGAEALLTRLTLLLSELVQVLWLGFLSKIQWDEL